MPDSNYFLAVQAETLKENIESLQKLVARMPLDDALNMLGLAAVLGFRQVADLKEREACLRFWQDKIRIMVMDEDDS